MSYYTHLSRGLQGGTGGSLEKSVAGHPRRIDWGGKGCVMRKMLSLLLALTLGASFWVGTAGAVDYPGLDVSVFQGEIDFTQVRQAGREVVYIRASEDLQVDARFRENAVEARQAGMRVGFYHSLTARDEAQAQEQARFFAQLIRNYTYECRPAVDYETFRDLDRAEINRVALAFARTLEAETGITPLFYTDAYNARTLWEEALSVYPLWVADYSQEPTDLGPWETWAGFQYADDGAIPGIAGAVDLDRFTQEIFLRGEETVPSNPARNQSVFDYTIRRGDTLWGLARRFDTTVTALVEENHIANPDLIYAGEVLRVPDQAKETFQYQIRRGDTLWAIARRFDTTVSALASLNRIANPDLIYAGEILHIPR